MNVRVSTVKLVALTVALPAGFANRPWVALLIAGWWSLWWLPDWALRWLDVRDRWHRDRA